MTSAFSASRYTHSDKGWIVGAERLKTAHRVTIVGVTSIDHDIARLKIGLEAGGFGINGCASLDQENDWTWFADIVSQFFKSGARDNLVTQRASFFDECLQDGLVAVIDGYRVALLGDVQRKVRTHNAEADHSDICFFHFLPF